MALSRRPWVALVALVALVAPVAPQRPVCPRTSGEATTLNWSQEDPGALEVTNGAPWGQWGDTEFCPPGTFASGFQLKMHSYQGFFRDDSGLNGVRLLCDNGTNTVTSSVGPYGSWEMPMHCPPGEHLVSFRLRVEPWRGLWDDAAATDMDVTCSGGHALRGGGLQLGEWGDWSGRCKRGCAVCGVRARVDPDHGTDISGLTDLRLYCCPS